MDYKIRKIDLWLWWLFPLWLLVDSITGYFINSGANMPLSQLFKFLILILLLLALIIRKKINHTLAICSFYLSIFFISVILCNREIGPTIVHLSKMLSLLLLFIYFKLSIKILKNKYLNNVFLVLKVGFFILIINLLLGLLGFGFHTYSNLQLGQKGFFYAGNEVGGLVIALFPIALFYCYFKYSRIKYFLFSIILIILSVSLATKTVILTTIISVFAIPTLYTSSKTRRIIIFCIIFLIYICSQFIILDSSNPMIDKLTWAYQSGGLTELIFSGRDEFFDRELNIFLNASIFQRLLGLGGGITVEMDPFDVLFNYGYIGFICTVFIIIYLLYILYKNRNNNIYCKCLFFQDLILIIVSIIAGHLLFSSMASLFIALINSLMFIKIPGNNFFYYFVDKHQLRISSNIFLPLHKRISKI